MKIRCGQDLLALRLAPLCGCLLLALRAVAVAAGVVTGLFKFTLIAMDRLPSQCLGTTLDNVVTGFCLCGV